MQFIYNDGGRKTAGYKGLAGDCVVRAIAIVTDKPYQEVYEALEWRNRTYAIMKRGKVAKRLRFKGPSPRNGNFKPVYQEFLAALGFTWVPTMFIGSGCKVHLKAGELPMGRIIASVSKHLVAVVDGVIHDTHDCSRNETRCVYGYYKQEG